MTQLRVLNHGKVAGVLEYREEDQTYFFCYTFNYKGPPISITMPVEKLSFQYQKLPAFFDGLLPEGVILEALLKQYKLDRHDYMGQLQQLGQDLVGSVTLEAFE